MTKLSIIISTRNDSVGALVTICSALEEFSTLNYKCEIVVVDNSDKPQHFVTLRKLTNVEYKRAGIIRIYKQDHQCLFTARELAVSEARGKYLLFVDSHCLFGRDSIKNLVEFADNTSNVGLVYGLMCYSVHHEIDAFCDRGVTDFLGIRLSQHSNRNKHFKIPSRGMPFLCTKKLFKKMKGYYTLSKYRLPWGGGDFLLGFKSIILGYDNWMVTTATVVHIGPFRKDCYLPPSYIREAGREYPKRFGMIITAYIIGGERLVKTRIEQLSSRLGVDTLDDRTIQQAISMGEEERRWLWSNAKKTYPEIVCEFKKLQRKRNAKIRRSSIPKSGNKAFDKPKRLIKKRHNRDDWRSRIANQTVN